MPLAIENLVSGLYFESQTNILARSREIIDMLHGLREANTMTSADSMTTIEVLTANWSHSKRDGQSAHSGHIKESFEYQ